MNLEKCIIQKRPVKHARIQVNRNNQVKLIVPNNFTNQDIDSLKRKKEKWIVKQVSYFESIKKNEIKIKDNEILFYGAAYKFILSPNEKTLIDKRNRIIIHHEDLCEEERRIRWYRETARKHLAERVNLISKMHNLNYNKLFIRSQSTKWGNCSSKKNISLNWKLIKTPENVQNYIISHELLHTKIMNHSREFWIYLSSIMPDYQKSRDWLKNFGSNL